MTPEEFLKLAREISEDKGKEWVTVRDEIIQEFHNDTGELHKKILVFGYLIALVDAQEGLSTSERLVKYMWEDYE